MLLLGGVDLSSLSDRIHQRKKSETGGFTFSGFCFLLLNYVYNIINERKIVCIFCFSLNGFVSILKEPIHVSYVIKFFPQSCLEYS